VHSEQAHVLKPFYADRATAFRQYPPQDELIRDAYLQWNRIRHVERIVRYLGHSRRHDTVGDGWSDPVRLFGTGPGFESIPKLVETVAAPISGGGV